MEALAAGIAAFCLQKHYIKPDQIAWLQYGLMRRLMGMVTFLLLLPVGAFFDGWGSTFLFLLVFRFIRMRTGGYHAKTPEGCLLGSTFTMIVSLELAKRLHPVSNLICLTAASVLILRLAPANNAALHLNAEELVAVRKEVKLRLAIVMLSACLLLFFREPIAYRVTSAILAVAVTLLISKLGLGMQ